MESRPTDTGATHLTAASDRQITGTQHSRRTFLAVATTGALAGVGATGVRGQSRPATIRLGGETMGWQGRAPDRIAGETNPTLELVAGRDYRIVWTNLDGASHNVAVLDGGGSVLERTETMAEKDATQTLEFTASEAMAEYVCEVHPTSMRGGVSVGRGGGGTQTGTTTATETPGGTDDTEPYIPTGPSVRVEQVVDDDRLAAPLGFEVPPDGTDRQFIVDRLGTVFVREGDGLRAEPFIDVADRLAEITGEMGLLGMAFHPDFGENRRFYLRYSAPRREGTPEDFDHTEVLSEFTATGDGTTGRPDTERAILEIPSPYDTHNAGEVLFGPDGYLYMGMGDGGGGKDTGTGHVADWYDRNEGGNAQDVSANLLGSVLRIDVDGESDGNPYGIPDDNPLVGRNGLPEHYAWGFRNPWRMSFNDGRLFVADVGQSLYEEVNVVEKGGNYGWNVREGTHCFDPENTREPPATCPRATPADVRGGEPLLDPIIEYPHTHEGQAVGSAVIGGYVYGRDDIPSIEGKYVFADFRRGKTGDGPESGALYAATPTEDGLWDLEELVVENREAGLLGAFPPALGRDDAGNVYVLTQQLGAVSSETGGAVHRIRPSENPRPTSDGAATAENTGTTTTATPATPTTANTQPAAGTSETADAGTATRTPTTADTTNATTGGSGGVSAGSEGSGPGFDVLAALGGLVVGAARLLTGRED